MYSKFAHIINKQEDSRLKAHHHVRLDREFRADCLVWKNFLRLKNASVVNRPMVDLSLIRSAKEIGFYSDASANENLGFGCIYRDQWIWGRWEADYIRKNWPSIEYLELYALCAGLFTWEKELQNARIIIGCDNKTVVFMINKLTSSCKKCMQLTRMITLNGLKHNRRVFARHL